MSLQSCPTLCDPINSSPPGSPVPEILQARTLEWVAISFSNAWKWKVKVKLLSRVKLLATPWTAAYQDPPSMWFSRQEYWSGVPLPSLRKDSKVGAYVMWLRGSQEVSVARAEWIRGGVIRDKGFHWWFSDKESTCNAGDVGSIPGSGQEDSPGEEHDYPLQYSCLGNPMRKGTWWATFPGGHKSQTWLSE